MNHRYTASDPRSTATSSSTSADTGTYTGTTRTDRTPIVMAPKHSEAKRRRRIGGLNPARAWAGGGGMTVPESVLPRP